MVVKEFRIRNYDGELYNWLANHPNFVNIGTQGNSNVVIVKLDVTPTEERQFKKDLANKINLQDDNLSKYLDFFDTDTLIFNSEKEITKTSLSSTYTDLYQDFNGRPFFMDTTGFKKVAIQIYWTKNGVGEHSLRVIKNNNPSHILFETILQDGETSDNNINIPNEFENTKGKARIEVKGNGTDSPTFSGIRILLRR